MIEAISSCSVKKGIMLVFLLCGSLETLMQAYSTSAGGCGRGANNSVVKVNNETASIKSEEEQDDSMLPKDHDTDTPPVNGIAIPPATGPSSSQTETTPRQPWIGSPPPPPKDMKIPPKLQQAIASNNPKRSIVLVHIGKTGGITVRENLAVKCTDMFKKKNLTTDEQARIGRSKCYESFPFQVNRLANQTRHVIHMWDINNQVMPSVSQEPPKEEEEVTSFLFTLRNPVDRIHSSYKYSHPANCGEEQLRRQQQQPGDNGYGCWALSHQLMVHGNPYHFMWDHCFPDPNMETFAQELLPPYPSSNQHFLDQNFTQGQMDACRQHARLMVQGIVGKVMNPHMFYNYKHYAQVTVQKYPQVQEVFAVRTEHQHDDMVRLDVALGGTGRFHRPNEHYSHGSEHYQPSTLSPESHGKLCCVLWDEIQIYLELMDKALNFDDNDQQQASDSLRNKCGIPATQSCSEWNEECGQRLTEAQQEGLTGE